MILPNDVCRCVNDTCPLRERCLRWQAFIADRERKEEGAYIGYARFEPEFFDVRNIATGMLAKRELDCEHAIWER